nr:hypothetical protein [Bacteroidota bacterium]
MLNRISHIILAFLILLTSIGMTLTMHYCGGQLKSVSVITTAEACCDTPGCCHNKTITIKIEDNFLIASDTFGFSQWAFEMPGFIELFRNDFADGNSRFTFLCTPAPPKLNPHFSLLQSFLL